jgi:hypothetical protein
MKAEWFTTEVQLLAATRADGHEAAAQDTGGRFVYEAGVGWIQYMPIGGVEGQPLVGVETEILPATTPIPRRTRIEFGSQNHLVPLGGESGQIAKLDEFGQTQVANRDDIVADTMPVDFSDSAIHTFTSRVINSGSLGPNGFARATVTARVITNAGRTVNFSTGFLNLTTANLTSSVNTHVLTFEVRLVNQNDVTLQSTTVSLENALFAPGSSTSAQPDRFMQTLVQNDFDTTDDWLFTFQVQASNVITGTAVIDNCLVEYGYVP